MDPNTAREVVARRLRETGFTTEEISLGQAEGVMAHRARWFASAKVREFVAICPVAGLTGQQAERLAEAAQQYAIQHKGGLPRGLQTGTLTLVVFLDADPQQSAIEWVDRAPVHRFAALRFPVLLDTAAWDAVYWDGKWLTGQLYRDDTLWLVHNHVLQPLSRSADRNGESWNHRRSTTPHEEQYQAALRASQASQRRFLLLMVLCLILPLTVVLYFVAGLGVAIATLIIGTLGVAAGTWATTRLIEQRVQTGP